MRCRARRPASRLCRCRGAGEAVGDLGQGHDEGQGARHGDKNDDDEPGSPMERFFRQFGGPNDEFQVRT